jgi:hypothetical protein
MRSLDADGADRAFPDASAASDADFFTHSGDIIVYVNRVTGTRFHARAATRAGRHINKRHDFSVVPTVAQFTHPFLNVVKLLAQDSSLLTQHCQFIRGHGLRSRRRLG